MQIGIGLPLYVGPGPYYYGYGYPYYPPAYVVLWRRKVIYQQRAAGCDGSTECARWSEAVPTPAPQQNASTRLQRASMPLLVPVTNQASPEVNTLVNQLSQTSETGRRDAALQLGRLKAASAPTDALANMLAKDTSPDRPR